MSERDTSDGRHEEPRDHALRLLLEEKLGQAPPDLRASILKRARAGGAVPARPGPSEEPPEERELVGASVGEPTFDARDAALSFEDVAHPRTGPFRPHFGRVGEVCSFLAAHAKWWLTPIWIVVAIVGFALILGGTGAAPFIYTMF